MGWPAGGDSPVATPHGSGAVDSCREIVTPTGLGNLIEGR
jgi:hypothetical protein